MIELYLCVYQGVLPVFTKFNLLLQCQDPQIHILYDEMTQFIKRLFGKFVQSQLIKDAGLDLNAITSIEYENVENELNGKKHLFKIVNMIR